MNVYLSTTKAKAPSSSVRCNKNNNNQQSGRNDKQNNQIKKVQAEKIS